MLVALLAVTGRAGAQPSEADVFVAEGILALEDKKYDEALAGFRQALQREPDHVEALYYAGVTLMAQNQAAEAVPFLERARKISPSEISVGFQLGLAYVGANLFDEASPLLEDVFRRDPGLDSLGYYVGYLRYRKENYQSALQAFRAGRTTDPNIAQLTRLYAGLALGKLGLPAQAAAEVEQALRLQPVSPLTAPAERLRQSFSESRTQNERKFRAYLRLGGFFDDNVTVRPDPHNSSDTVNALRPPAHESFGELATLRLANRNWKISGKDCNDITEGAKESPCDRFPAQQLDPTRMGKDVRRRMRGVRRHQQHAPALTAGRERHGGGAGRLANTTLPTEEEDSLAKKITHRQQQGMLPIGERSMPMRRCQVWNSSRKNG